MKEGRKHYSSFVLCACICFLFLCNADLECFSTARSKQKQVSRRGMHQSMTTKASLRGQNISGLNLCLGACACAGTGLTSPSILLCHGLQLLFVQLVFKPKLVASAHLLPFSKTA